MYAVCGVVLASGHRHMTNEMSSALHVTPMAPSRAWHGWCRFVTARLFYTTTCKCCLESPLNITGHPCTRNFQCHWFCTREVKIEYITYCCAGFCYSVLHSFWHGSRVVVKADGKRKLSPYLSTEVWISFMSSENILIADCWFIIRVIRDRASRLGHECLRFLSQFTWNA